MLPSPHAVPSAASIIRSFVSAGPGSASASASAGWPHGPAKGTAAGSGLKRSRPSSPSLLGCGEHSHSIAPHAPTPSPSQDARPAKLPRSAGALHAAGSQTAEPEPHMSDAPPAAPGPVLAADPDRTFGPLSVSFGQALTPISMPLETRDLLRYTAEPGTRVVVPSAGLVLYTTQRWNDAAQSHRTPGEKNVQQSTADHQLATAKPRTGARIKQGTVLSQEAHIGWRRAQHMDEFGWDMIQTSTRRPKTQTAARAILGAVDHDMFACFCAAVSDQVVTALGAAAKNVITPVIACTVKLPSLDLTIKSPFKFGARGALGQSPNARPRFLQTSASAASTNTLFLRIGDVDKLKNTLCIPRALAVLCRVSQYAPNTFVSRYCRSWTPDSLVPLPSDSSSSSSSSSPTGRQPWTMPRILGARARQWSLSDELALELSQFTVSSASLGSVRLGDQVSSVSPANQIQQPKGPDAAGPLTPAAGTLAYILIIISSISRSDMPLPDSQPPDIVATACASDEFTSNRAVRSRFLAHQLSGLPSSARSSSSSSSSDPLSDDDEEDDDDDDDDMSLSSRSGSSSSCSSTGHPASPTMSAACPAREPVGDMSVPVRVPMQMEMEPEQGAEATIRVANFGAMRNDEFVVDGVEHLSGRTGDAVDARYATTLIGASGTWTDDRIVSPAAYIEIETEATTTTTVPSVMVLAFLTDVTMLVGGVIVAPGMTEKLDILETAGRAIGAWLAARGSGTHSRSYRAVAIPRSPAHFCTEIGPPEQSVLRGIATWNRSNISFSALFTDGIALPDELNIFSYHGIFVRNARPAVGWPKADPLAEKKGLVRTVPAIPTDTRSQAPTADGGVALVCETPSDKDDDDDDEPTDGSSEADADGSDAKTRQRRSSTVRATVVVPRRACCLCDDRVAALPVGSGADRTFGPPPVSSGQTSSPANRLLFPVGLFGLCPNPKDRLRPRSETETRQKATAGDYIFSVVPFPSSYGFGSAPESADSPLQHSRRQTADPQGRSNIVMGAMPVLARLLARSILREPRDAVRNCILAVADEMRTAWRSFSLATALSSRGGAALAVDPCGGLCHAFFPASTVTCSCFTPRPGTNEKMFAEHAATMCTHWDAACANCTSARRLAIHVYDPLILAIVAKSGASTIDMAYPAQTQDDLRPRLRARSAAAPLGVPWWRQARESAGTEADKDKETMSDERCVADMVELDDIAVLARATMWVGPLHVNAATAEDRRSHTSPRILDALVAGVMATLIVVPESQQKWITIFPNETLPNARTICSSTFKQRVEQIAAPARWDGAGGLRRAARTLAFVERVLSITGNGLAHRDVTNNHSPFTIVGVVKIALAIAEWAPSTHPVGSASDHLGGTFGVEPNSLSRTRFSGSTGGGDYRSFASVGPGARSGGADALGHGVASGQACGPTGDISTRCSYYAIADRALALVNDVVSEVIQTGRTCTDDVFVSDIIMLAIVMLLVNRPKPAAIAIFSYLASHRSDPDPFSFVLDIVASVDKAVHVIALFQSLNIFPIVSMRENLLAVITELLKNHMCGTDRHDQTVQLIISRVQNIFSMYSD